MANRACSGDDENGASLRWRTLVEASSDEEEGDIPIFPFFIPQPNAESETATEFVPAQNPRTDAPDPWEGHGVPFLRRRSESDAESVESSGACLCCGRLLFGNEMMGLTPRSVWRFDGDLYHHQSVSPLEPFRDEQVCAREDDFSLRPSGLRVAGPGSESDSDDTNLGLQLLWGTLPLGVPTFGTEFDWDNIYSGRDAGDAIAEVDLDRIYEAAQEEGDGDDDYYDEDDDAGELEREFLLAVNRELSHGDEPYLAYDDDGLMYAMSEEAANEVFFEQGEAEGAKGSPPAAISAVESLPRVIVGEEEELHCAVCKERMTAEERVRRMPCRHCYHEQCILPWLEMRNTCPLCRHELPTDDADYEKAKAGGRREAAASPFLF